MQLRTLGDSSTLSYYASDLIPLCWKHPAPPR